MKVKHFSFDLMGKLSQDAQTSLRARHHQNIHQSYDDPCQRLFNAIEVDSYIRPHRHLIDPKVECLIAVCGLFSLLTFDDFGKPLEIMPFGSEKYSANGFLNVGVELSPDAWHTVVALLPGSVLLELKAGPFDPAFSKEFALWAPEEKSVEAGVYFDNLRCLAESGILKTRPFPIRP